MAHPLAKPQFDSEAFTGARNEDADPPEVAFERRMEEIIGRLQTMIDERVRGRQIVEQRWLEDLRQFHGFYSTLDSAEITRHRGAQTFINVTRAKTNALIARLNDLLFPTDDKNWGIQPTPVPDLVHGQAKVQASLDAAAGTMEEAEALGQEAAALGDQAGKLEAQAAYDAAEEQFTEAQTALEELSDILEEARDRADLMAEEMDDQLKACAYAAACRDMIEDACKIGTGVIKGPITGEAYKLRYRKAEGSNVYDLAPREENRPGYCRVDPWNFFPENGMRYCDGDSTFERHPMTPQQFRRFVNGRPDIDKDVARKLLKDGPQERDNQQYLIDLYGVTGQAGYKHQPRFIVWEYTGPLEPEDVEFLARATGDEGFATSMAEVDPLIDVVVRIWFCEGKVLAFAQHPLDSNEPIYSVFNVEKDETGAFGFGVPYLLRAPQSSLNAAWRMMLDNAAVGCGPQIVVNRQVVEAEDGNNTIYANKIWNLTKALTGVSESPFWTFDIPIHQAELANIVQMSRDQMDDVTGITAIAQGEQGGLTKTFQGMALLMNASNVIFRRIVRNFDDDVTVPNIRRLYHFNMQFSKKDEIKGDYEVDARGSSVLLVREIQAQNLMLMLNFIDHPKIGPAIKTLDLVRETFKALMLSASQFVETDVAYEKAMQEQMAPEVQAAEIQKAAAEAQMELERERLDAEAARATMENDSRIEVALIGQETEMMKAAQAGNINDEKMLATMQVGREKLMAMLADKREDRQSSERKLAVEAAMKQQTGDSAGGSI